MPRLTDFVKPKVSFKKGSFGFKKRRKVAEAIGNKNPAMPMANKFKIATAAVEKSAE